MTLLFALIGTTNISIDFTLWKHTGNKVTYNWTFSDGNENVTTSQDMSHTYTDSGVYTVTVVAWNKISSASWTVRQSTVILHARLFRTHLSVILTTLKYNLNYDIIQSVSVTSKLIKRTFTLLLWK